MLNFSFFFKKKCAFPAFSENSISKYNNNFINNNNLENVRKMQELRQTEKCAFLILSQQGEEEEKNHENITASDTDNEEDDGGTCYQSQPNPGSPQSTEAQTASRYVE